MFAIQSIVEFLGAHREESPLIDRYLSYGGPASLETQCNMIPGTKVPGDDRLRTDGEYEWHQIRIPHNADSDPYWPADDHDLSFPFADYIEAIGWSGWLWHKRQTILLIFDIDADDHADGLSPDQIKLLENPNVEWIEVRRSKGGKGIHWYVWLSVPMDTIDHTEHAQLGAYVRDQLIAPALGMTIPEIRKLIDKTGYIGWLWHAKAAPNAYELVRAAKNPLDVESIGDWKSHVCLPAKRDWSDGPKAITPELAELQKRLREAGWVADYCPEISALRTHKLGLVEVQQFYPGEFKTISPGTDPGSPNCWVRIGDGDGWVEEIGPFKVWSFQNEPGWNNEGRFSFTTFGAAAPFESVGTPKSDNVRSFPDAESLADGIRKLTGERPEFPELLKQGRREYEFARKGSVFQARITPLKGDPDSFPDMIRGKSHWWLSVELPDNTPPPKMKVEQLSDVILFTKQGSSSQGLVINDGISKPFYAQAEFVRAYIRASTGVADPQPFIDKAVLGYCELTFEPFGPVLQPGQPRRFNIGPQFKVKPQEGNCIDILSVFEHLGQGIDEDVKANPDCQKMGITSGRDYLLSWFAGMIQRPSQTDVGLFAHGPKNSAKSTIVDIFRAIVDGGIADAAPILLKNSQFTGPVATSVLATLEERDCSSQAITDRLCDWMTVLKHSAEFKHRNPFDVTNCVHIYGSANDASYAPFSDGDSRFTVIPCEKLPYVDPQFAAKIRSQAPGFLHFLLEHQLPEPWGRSALPPLDTVAKDEIQENKRSQEEQFAVDCLTDDPDGRVSNDDLFTRYEEWCDKPGRVKAHNTAQSLLRSLSRKLTMMGATPYKSGTERGRKSIRLVSLSS